MAHPAQQLFIRQIRSAFEGFFIKTKVLEIGSLNINGTVRIFFEKPKLYVGCDLGPGPGVDTVSYGHELQYQAGFFDVSISCECFEHDRYWKKTFQKMWELVRPAGLVVFSCATEGREEHGTVNNGPHVAPFTNDYYNNLKEEDFLQSFNLSNMFSYYNFSVNNSVNDLYFWGISTS